MMLPEAEARRYYGLAVGSALPARWTFSRGAGHQFNSQSTVTPFDNLLVLEFPGLEGP
jgi:hypothetical protein